MSGDTRQRILAVANELFIEQGYEGTSLREIADRLDITKAALYYHFRSKDDILQTLLEPFDTLLDELLQRLEAAHDVEAWADALTWVVDKVFDYLDGDDCVLEHEPLQRLAAEGQMVAYRHEGNFLSMDTYREYTQLNQMWQSGNPPWRVWSDG